MIPLVLAGFHDSRTTAAHVAASDGGLLVRFVAQRDENAFSALVHRHGPLVLGVCRRLLAHRQDAEDAFQATFLVLDRKAGAMRGGEQARSPRRCCGRRVGQLRVVDKLVDQTGPLRGQ